MLALLPQLLWGIDACTAKLDSLKVNNPDMRMVVSMSLGLDVTALIEIFGQAIIDEINWLDSIVNAYFYSRYRLDGINWLWSGCCYAFDITRPRTRDTCLLQGRYPSGRSGRQ